MHPNATVCALALVLAAAALAMPAAAAGDIAYSDISYAPEYPAVGEDITITVTMQSTNPLEYVNIYVCNDDQCMPPEPMTDRGGGVYDYFLAGTVTQDFTVIKIYFSAQDTAGNSQNSEGVDGIYTLVIHPGQEDPNVDDAPVEDDWDNYDDSDQDLIPDWWETKNGMDPDDGSDATQERVDQYQAEYNAATGAQTGGGGGDDEKDSPGFGALAMVAGLCAVLAAVAAMAGRRR